MPEPIWPDRVTETFESTPPGVKLPVVRTVPPHPVYDLRLHGANSDRYYEEAAGFSDRVIAEIEMRAADLLDGYSHHVQDHLLESGRSRGDYAIELLTLGLAYQRYAGAAESTPGWIVDLARELFWWRRRSAKRKPVTDLLRAALTRLLIMPRMGHPMKGPMTLLERLPPLIEWLQATGEFEQEAARLDNWRSYFATIPGRETEEGISAAIDIFRWFENEAAVVFGAYTRGVDLFLETEYRRRRWRDDQIFCGRGPVEYHLAMVTAEGMNRGSRAQFEATERRVVLVPDCMRGRHAEVCRPQISGTDIRCTGCDPGCTVNRITQDMRNRGAQVFIIPHAPGFSRYLMRWQNQPQVGVVAVACLLNILPGGYEMRARGIVSQVVPLDYPACSRHWDREGATTAVNEARLMEMVSARPR